MCGVRRPGDGHPATSAHDRVRPPDDLDANGPKSGRASARRPILTGYLSPIGPVQSSRGAPGGDGRN